MERRLKAILFDLDNTLYDARAGLQEAGDRRITDWIMRTLAMPREQADAFRVRTWREYGTTAKGLEVEYGIDGRGLYEYAISSLEPAEYLRPWPELAHMLARLGTERHVFTNATAAYSRKVLDALGVSAFFDRIFDIEHNGWVCKPHRPIYDDIVAELGLPAHQIAFVEDNPSNLAPARDVGMLTVLLTQDGSGDAEWDVSIAGILDLPEALGAAGA